MENKPFVSGSTFLNLQLERLLDFLALSRILICRQMASLSAGMKQMQEGFDPPLIHRHPTRHASPCWAIRGSVTMRPEVHWTPTIKRRSAPDAKWLKNCRLMEAILKTDGKQSPTGPELKKKRKSTGVGIYLFSGAEHLLYVYSHETQRNDHGYEVMFGKRELPGTSFTTASEVKCPLRKSPWLQQQRYKFVKNEQVFSCLTNEQTNCVLLWVHKVTASEFMIFATVATYALSFLFGSMLEKLRLDIHLKWSLFSRQQTRTLPSLLSVLCLYRDINCENMAAQTITTPEGALFDASESAQSA